MHNGELRDVKVYGYTGNVLERPSNIYSAVNIDSGCSFREFLVYAVDLSHYKEELLKLGVSNDKNVYFVNGAVCVLTRNEIAYPDWYVIDGTLRFGTRNSFEYVTMLNYRKSGGTWVIEENKLCDFSAKEVFNRDLQLVAFGQELLPEEVMSLNPMKAVLENTNIAVERNFRPPIERVPYYAKEANYFRAVDRSNIKEFSSYIEKFKDICIEADYQLSENIKAIKIKYPINGDTSYLVDLLNRLEINLKRKATPKCLTGRMVLNRYLSTFGKKASFKYQGKSIKTFFVENMDIVREFAIYKESAYLKGNSLELAVKAFSDTEKFYSGLITAITGIDLTSALNVCKSNNISLVKVLNNNPYVLTAMGVLSFSSADTLTSLICYGNIVSLQRFRNMCILHEYVEHSNNHSTMYNINELRSIDISLKAIAGAIDESAKVFLYSDRELFYRDTPVKFSLGGNALIQAITDYKNYGLGVLLEKKYVTSLSILKKEIFVYEQVYDKGKITFEYDKDIIEQHIKDYEEFVGFNLEDQQKKAVYLLLNGAGCITGQAGSGKTTSLGCFLYVLRQLNPDAKIKFGAPTGKAARVLKGVVMEPVKTLNSLCKINPDEQYNIFSPYIEENEEDIEGYIYFFDEFSMVNLNLMYSVLKKINASRLYFTGDYNQLEAIGKGNVFKTLLQFLPTVVLNVSKRSSENSGIAYNGDMVCNYSDRDNWLSMKETDDFHIIPCQNDEISSTVEEICNLYLGKSNINRFNLPLLEGVVEDDIQVVTPYVQSSCNWGTKVLNSKLQPLFNKARGYTDTIEINNTTFNKGDRVIHTTKNAYSMQWYGSYEEGKFQKIYGCGIANGEIGIFKGVISTYNASFYDEVGLKPSDFSYPDNMREDSTFDVVNSYFIIVEYKDVVTGEPYYILYRSILNDDNKLVSYDTELLDLFYAGSTHKLQGSQSRICICCLGSVNYGNFLTRNMLYTMITRGSDLVILVGSMSQINRSRCTINTEGTLTVGQLLLEK